MQKDEIEEEEDEDSGGFSSGWFPADFSRPPTPLELAAMQASLHPSPDESADPDDPYQSQKLVDPLAPPETWETKDNPDPLHPVLVDIEKDDPERQELEAFFKESLGDTKSKLKGIKSVKRIESIGLWQSFVTKKRMMQMRAKAEGHDDDYAKAYEQVCKSRHHDAMISRSLMEAPII